MKNVSNFCRRLGGLVLAGCLALTALTACNTNKGDSVVEMGRYVEREIASLSDAGRVMAAKMNPEGSFTFYTSRQRNFTRHTGSSDGLGSETEVAWLNEIGQANGNVISLSESGSGALYALCMDMEGKYTLVRSTDGETYAILPVTDLENIDSGMDGVFFSVTEGLDGAVSKFGESPEGEGDDILSKTTEDEETAQGTEPSVAKAGAVYGGAVAAGGRGGLGAPSSVIALEEGFLLSYGFSEIRQYDADGAYIRTYAESSMNSLLSVYGNTLVIGLFDKPEIHLYDLSSGRQTDSITYEGAPMQSFVGIDEKGVILGNSTGISRYENGRWQLLVDGGLTSLIMPTSVISQLLGDGQGGYYALLGDQEVRLVQFTYNENMPSQPDTTLEVFSLYDNSTLRLAIGEFQRNNPNVRVNLNVALDESSGATAEDVIRTLNTQLIAGKGPDLLVLDGLPVESYIEKGVLKDISALANRLADGNTFMRNLINAYASNEKIYGLPSRFILPVMIGDTKALETLNSLEDLINAVEAGQSETPSLLRTPDSLWGEDGLVMEYYEACAANWIRPDGSIDQAALEAYFSDIMALDKVLKENSVQSASLFMAVATMGGGGTEVIDLGSRDLKDDKSKVHLQNLIGVFGLTMIANDLGDRSDMSLTSMFNAPTYYAKGGIGVVAAGKQQDLAERFVEYLLSSEVQNRYAYDGFPVNPQSLQSMVEEQKTMERSTFTNDMGFLDLCQSLTEAISSDQVIKNAVQNLAKDLISGSLTPAQAAAKVVENTRLYLAE